MTPIADQEWPSSRARATASARRRSASALSKKAALTSRRAVASSMLASSGSWCSNRAANSLARSNISWAVRGMVDLVVRDTVFAGARSNRCHYAHKLACSGRAVNEQSRLDSSLSAAVFRSVVTCSPRRTLSANSRRSSTLRAFSQSRSPERSSTSACACRRASSASVSSSSTSSGSMTYRSNEPPAPPVDNSWSNSDGSAADPI